MEVCIISEKTADRMICEDIAVWIDVRVMSIVVVGRVPMTRPTPDDVTLDCAALEPHTNFVLPGTAIGGSGSFMSQS